jgi:hypothetical protein
MAAYKEGAQIEVFHRLSINPNCPKWLATPTRFAGTRTPRFGQSDGWQRAVVEEDFDQHQFDPDQLETGVLIRYVHPFWYDKDGQSIDPQKDSDEFLERVHPDATRPLPEGAAIPPDISFVVVRWGGEQPVDPVIGGNGGWGDAGSSVSDVYIRTFFEEVVWPTLGPRYEVITFYVRDSSDLGRIQAPLVTPMLQGRHKIGLYFLWPVVWQDTPTSPGFVNSQALLSLMHSMEACGVVSRFPHHSHLYRLLLSKDWMCHLCLQPEMHVPATTKISRSVISIDPRE